MVYAVLRAAATYDLVAPVQKVGAEGGVQEVNSLTPGGADGPVPEPACRRSSD